ncbi:MAG: tetratricopeptide repeat protein [Anaerolineae bacterium]|nr:tetratricopeptide repeat protein [Anaerolineae bacterium]
MGLEDRIRLPNLNLIHRRSRLLNLLDKFTKDGRRLITIYAPGGYGKSILLADFAQTTDLPICWCSLEPTDRDPTSFLTLLAYSIADRFHEIESNSLLKLVKRGDTQNSVRRIAELLQTVDSHIIILDDYHKAVSAGMTLALNRLLAQLPETSTIIVAARGDMTLDTGQIIDLLISERATGLSEEELRFTGDEIMLVMRKRFGRRVSLQEAEEIAQATDGNIAQVLLTGHMMHANRLIGYIRRRLGGDRQVIYDYLAQEVFGKQSSELQKFMLYTAILPDLTPELCSALFETNQAQEYLDELVDKDLFITQIGVSYKYHDLFAEFLRMKLAEDEDLHRQVSLKAAEILASLGRYDEAIYLYISVQAWNRSTSLLEKQGRSFYDTGRAMTLNAWLSQIPAEILSQHPRLLLLRGQILNIDLGEPDKAISLFQQAELKFKDKADFISAAEAQVWQSVGMRMKGEVGQAFELAKQGVEQLEAMEADGRILAFAFQNQGIFHRFLGDLKAALIDLRRALELYEFWGDTYQVGLCHHDIGVCLDREGNVNGAIYHFKQAIRIWEALGNASDLSNTLNSLGVCLYTIGQYNEALEYFSHSLDIALQIGASRRAAFAQASIGDVYLEQQQFDQAIRAFHTSIGYAQDAGVRSLEIYVLIRLGECHYQQGDFIEALQLAIQAKEYTTEARLNFERGLALTLQAKIYMRQTEYKASFTLFQEAFDCFSQSSLLEQTKVSLLWSYSLLLDLRASAAQKQLQESLKLSMRLNEASPGLGLIISEIKSLLRHFLYSPDAPVELQSNVRLLLKQDVKNVTQSVGYGLQTFLLGSPSLLVKDKRRLFSQRGRSRKMPEFLAYLLLEGRDGGCRWSEITTALWPDLDPDKASSTFHQTLRRLRDTMFETSDYIVVKDDYYQINPKYLDWCDVITFEKLLERIPQVDPEEALNLQMEIIALYRGEFLAGFELEEWGMHYRTWYETKFLQAVKLASERLLEQNLPQEALHVIHQGLAYDYFREDLHRAAFKAYVQLGLHDHLRTHYATLRDILKQEFNAPPDPNTVSLYEQVIAKKQIQFAS